MADKLEMFWECPVCGYEPFVTDVFDMNREIKRCPKCFQHQIRISKRLPLKIAKVCIEGSE